MKKMKSLTGESSTRTHGMAYDSCTLESFDVVVVVVVVAVAVEVRIVVVVVVVIVLADSSARSVFSSLD